MKPIDEAALRMAMKKCGMKFLPEASNDEIIDRCSGDMICSICGNDYKSHPLDPRVFEKNNEPFLQIICDGRRVKL